MNIRTSPATLAQLERLKKSLGAASFSEVWRRGLDALERETTREAMPPGAEYLVKEIEKGFAALKDDPRFKIEPCAEVEDETKRASGGLRSKVIGVDIPGPDGKNEGWI